MFSLEIIESAYGNKTAGELVSNWQKKKEERRKNVCGQAKLKRWHTVGGKPVTPPTEWRRGGGNHYLKVFGLRSHSERKKENCQLHLVFLCSVLQ